MGSKFENFDFLRIHQYSTFDPPEADKCLLAFGELGVRCSTFNLFTVLSEL